MRPLRWYIATTKIQNRLQHMVSLHKLGFMYKDKNHFSNKRILTNNLNIGILIRRFALFCTVSKLGYSKYQ